MTHANYDSLWPDAISTVIPEELLMHEEGAGVFAGPSSLPPIPNP
jgi:hypothetical protein